ncbi:MAG: NAD(P)-dependent oxidoreductase, partial [Microbacterium sp.]
ERLEAAGLDLVHLPPMSGSADPAHLAGLDAVLAFGHLAFDGRIAHAAPRLSLIARFGAGYDGIDLEGLARAGVAVTNTPTAVRGPMARATLTMILALAHRMLENHHSAASGGWAQGRGRFRGVGVAGRRLGIIGFGGIGASLADMATAVGFDVAVSEHPSTDERARNAGLTTLPLGELVAGSDFVVLAVGLSPATRHLVDAALLRSMKPSAYLVNTSRGEIVDQDALRTALAEGWIAGAALDVLSPEPPAPDDPILTAPNVLLSAHCLAWTTDFTEAVSASVIESIITASRGEHPHHTLNPAVYSLGWRGALDGARTGVNRDT